MPTGFSYLNPDNTLEGCKPNFAAQSCGSNEFRNEKVLFKMEAIPNTTWVLSDFEQYSPVDEGFAVSLYDNGIYLKKKRLPLSNGRAGPSIKAKTLCKSTQKQLDPLTS
ncbi:G-type lectin S-receptor-like serine/threonine-protein kinase LECRK3 [Cinnamomum micranthum f. kanehirae]|uniref:G-type lectin S-receptor-like serine/threonine-protein kinase LECRK3 n=1 Tax=Cinnamomum micranthum f. kanehirae TaxID=337451 RepID=A0A443N2J0_9MAGN|nr:G-type lectin S-receptor-like serine/threonine-protein kinase LECRK3 [Cinnamomum micranthum f. kanehirae]